MKTTKHKNAGAVKPLVKFRKYVKGASFEEIAEVITEAIDKTIEDVVVEREAEIWEEVIQTVKKAKPQFWSADGRIGYYLEIFYPVKDRRKGRLKFGMDRYPMYEHVASLNRMIDDFIETGCLGNNEELLQLSKALQKGADRLSAEYEKRKI